MTDYLNASTEPKLRAIVEEELVKVHATTLIEVRSLRPSLPTHWRSVCPCLPACLYA